MTSTIGSIQIELLGVGKAVVYTNNGQLEAKARISRTHIPNSGLDYLSFEAVKVLFNLPEYCKSISSISKFLSLKNDLFTPFAGKCRDLLEGVNSKDSSIRGTPLIVVSHEVSESVREKTITAYIGGLSNDYDREMTPGEKSTLFTHLLGEYKENLEFPISNIVYTTANPLIQWSLDLTGGLTSKVLQA